MKGNQSFYKLIESLRLLSSNFATQKEILPDFSNIPDELALIFDESFRLYKNNEENAKKDILNHLEDLNSILDKMSDEKELWTLVALKKSNKWKKVRKMATQILKKLKIKKEKTNLNWIKFIH